MSWSSLGSADGRDGAVDEPKAVLHEYLQTARDVMLWKLDGLGEYDVRRPLTPTSTNLLGLVKHLASVELGYFGAPFGRPGTERLPWFDDGAEPEADMWVTTDETREEIVALYRRARAHADATIGELELDAVGHVAHWPPERAEITLHRALVHMIAETHRHAGHADIVRELVDGAVGHRDGTDNMGDLDADGRSALRARIERAAREAERV